MVTFSTRLTFPPRSITRREYAGRENELRAAVAKRLKLALNEGRAVAEQLLLKERHGRLCAAALLYAG